MRKCDEMEYKERSIGGKSTTTQVTKGLFILFVVITVTGSFTQYLAFPFNEKEKEHTKDVETSENNRQVPWSNGIHHWLSY